MKIPIPEIDERFECMEDALEQIIRSCRIIVDKAYIICPSPTVDDIPSYVLSFINKILVQATTLVMIARERNDYNTVCAMVRMIADNVAALNLVYNCEEDEEKVLRHLLYVMDGVTVRYDALVGHPMHYDGKIPQEAYDQLKLQVQGAIDNTAHCISFCEKAIKTRTTYKIFKSQIDTLIKKRDWKFRELGNPNKKSYSWKEMYSKLDIKTGDEMFPYLSQYVHGLSVSNIAIGDPEDFNAPLSFAYCLIGWLFNYLLNVYGPHLGGYTREDILKIKAIL